MKENPALTPEWTHDAKNVTPIDVTPPTSGWKGSGGTMTSEHHAEPEMNETSSPGSSFSPSSPSHVQIIQQRSPAASALAMAALLTALVAAGGGYYLWLKLADVQQLASKTSGVNQGQLDETKTALQQQFIAKLDQSVAEINGRIVQTDAGVATLVVQTKAEVDSQFNEKVSALDARLSEMATRIEQNVAALQGSIEQIKPVLAQQPEHTQAAITTVKSEILGELAKAVDATQVQTAALQSDVSSLRGAYSELRDSVNARIQAAEGAQAALKQTTAESTTALSQAASDAQARLQQAVTRSEAQWTLNEVEQILLIGQRQVALEHNPTQAITSFRTADQRLQTLTEPKLGTLRDAVRADLVALEKVNPPSVEDIVKALSKLEAQSLQLPSGPRISTANLETKSGGIGAEDVAQAKPVQAVRGLAEATWDAIRGQVITRQDGKITSPVLGPDQLFFLHQNLRLKLETARLAALRSDNVTFHASLSDTAQWVTDFFNAEAGETQQFLNGIRQLANINLNINLPDVSGSLKVLREVRADLS